MLILAITALWILVIPAAIILGSLALRRLSAPGVARRRRAVQAIWSGAAPSCEGRAARIGTRRPEPELDHRARREPTVSRH